MTGLRGWRRAWDRITLYIPIILMGMLALGTYWLARTTPSFSPAAPERPPTHDPDYFLRDFSVKSFDAAGRLVSEIRGVEARHYPDTETTEIDEPRMRSYNRDGAVIVAQAKQGISNADGSQIQLIGDAVVTREAPPEQRTREPKLEIRSDFLHAFLHEERVQTHQRVTLMRGADVFQADSMQFDNATRVLEMAGRVRGTLQPRGAQPPRGPAP